MAKKEENSKGFLIVKTESLTEAALLGGCAICDSCNSASFTGYYIAVLNSWYCEKCYNEWMSRATRYEEYIPIEQRNYSYYSKILGL